MARFGERPELVCELPSGKIGFDIWANQDGTPNLELLERGVRSLTLALDEEHLAAAVWSVHPARQR